MNSKLEGRRASATSLSSAITSGESGVEAAATGGEVGELFEYRVEQPVTVRRDRSALIPILQTKMEGERVSVYNEADAKRPPDAWRPVEEHFVADARRRLVDGDRR